MAAGLIHRLPSLILAAALFGAPMSLSARGPQAREVLELPGRDRLIEPAFEEVYSVGVA